MTPFLYMFNGLIRTYKSYWYYCYIFLSINCSIHSPSPIPPSPSSSHPSFLSPLVPTPHFLPRPLLLRHPSCLNNAAAAQLHCHCPRFNVNVVSLSQLLGHYHPSELIIVIQIRTNKTHYGEQRRAHVENKGPRGGEKDVALSDARVKLNDAPFERQTQQALYGVSETDATCKMYGYKLILFSDFPMGKST